MMPINDINRAGAVNLQQKVRYRDMSEIIECSKCKGTGKFIYKSGMIGHCYNCNGKGKVKKIPHKMWTAYITMDDGKEPSKWIGVNATSEKMALKKAKDVALKGCYAKYVDTVRVELRGIEYTYRPL